jgi:hypothetical protein
MVNTIKGTIVEVNVDNGKWHFTCEGQGSENFSLSLDIKSVNTLFKDHAIEIKGFDSFTDIRYATVLMIGGTKNCDIIAAPNGLVLSPKVFEKTPIKIVIK